MGVLSVYLSRYVAGIIHLDIWWPVVIVLHAEPVRTWLAIKQNAKPNPKLRLKSKLNTKFQKKKEKKKANTGGVARGGGIVLGLHAETEVSHLNGISDTENCSPQVANWLLFEVFVRELEWKSGKVRAGAHQIENLQI